MNAALNIIFEKTTPPEVMVEIKKMQTIGQRSRIIHQECSQGKDAALSITRNQQGWIWHCFRCHKSGVIQDDDASPRAVKNRVELLKKHPAYETVHRITMPHDSLLMPQSYSPECGVPIEAYNWLWENGFSNKYPRSWEKLRAAWSPAFQRVILPVYSTPFLQDNFSWPNYGRLRTMVGWVGRDVFFNKEQAKNKGINRYLIKKDQQIPRLVYHAEPDTLGKSYLFVVEDVLSANKVMSATQCHTIALLSSSLSKEYLAKLSAYKVVFWLDADARDKSIDMSVKSDNLGTESVSLYTQKDPKGYTISEICDITGPYMINGGTTQCGD